MMNKFQTHIYEYFCMICYKNSCIIQQASIMILYIVEGVILFIFTIIIVWYFSHESNPLYVRALVIMSFSLSFGCFMILPMDIYETSVESGMGKGISLTWKIVYDLNAFLCWLVLPLVQEYEDSGQFTRMGKFKQALKNNGILIGAIMVGAIALVIYLVIIDKFTIGQLPAVFATIINVFGLILISTMLGFGLVSFPKQNYMKIDYKKRVNRCHRMAESLRSDQQLIKEQAQQIMKLLDKKIRQGIVEDHEEQVLYLIQKNFDFSGFRSYADPNPKLQKQKISVLHTKIKKGIIQYNACESQLDELVDELTKVTIHFSKNNYSYLKIFYIVLLAITIIISVIVFWGQLCTFIQVFSVINVLRLIDWASPAAYIMNCLLILYIAFIVTHTVFRVKVYKMFSLHKKHSSSASLSFTAINLARISFPLCYNYTQITEIEHTEFLNFFGDINFNTKYAFVFPIVMIVLGVFNILDIYDTVLGYFGIGMYALDEEDAQEKAEEGQRILVEKLRQRNIETHKMEMIQLL